MVWNELDGCKTDVPRLPKDLFKEIYAVDGGSSDGTFDYLKDSGIPTYRQPIKSLNAAYHYAVEKCTSKALVVYFPKGTIAPTYLEDLVDAIMNHSDFVIASRNIAGAQNEEDLKLFKPRKWGVLLLSIFSSLCWRRKGPWIRDVLHGVKAFRIDAFKRMLISKTGVTIDLEMVIRSYRMGISMQEVPVIETPRICGETHFRTLKTAKSLMMFLLRELLTGPYKFFIY